MTPQITDEIARRLLLGQDFTPPAPTVDWHHERQSLGEGALLLLIQAACLLHFTLPMGAVLGLVPTGLQVWVELGIAVGLAVLWMAWRTLDSGMREVTGWLVLAGAVLNWSAGLLLGGEAFAVRATASGLMYIPLLSVALSLISQRSRRLLGGGMLLMVLIYVLGSRREALDGLPFLDWRFPISLFVTFAVLFYFLGVWARQVEQLLASRSREAILARAASVDPLTGISNRRAGEVMIETALSGPGPVALLSLDVDHFKEVNDTLGHQAGDAILCSLAAALARHLRSSDTICRWGGEEFLVVLTGDEAEEALRIADRLRRAVAEESAGWITPVTLSIGVAWARPGDGAGDLIRRADRAMYRAKASGRDQVIALDRQTPSSCASDVGGQVSFYEAS